MARADLAEAVQFIERQEAATKARKVALEKFPRQHSIVQNAASQYSWRLGCSARLREEVKSSFDGLYLARTLLLFPAHEGFLRSMIGESLPTSIF